MIYKRRFFSTPSGSSLSSKRPRYHASVPGKNYHNCLAVPTGINLETLEEILDPLQSEIRLYDKVNPEINTPRKSNAILMLLLSSQLGQGLLAHWSREEIGSTGWKSGKQS